MKSLHAVNKKLWDEWAELHARSDFYGVPEFLEGKGSLHALELSELGEVKGRSLLHLQCHFGLDTLRWARLGAVVTGMDFSTRGIALAKELAEQTGLEARFMCCNLFDLPEHLDETFDIVYTSYGVLTWLGDLPRWAQIVARYLKPGGVFYMAEFHPFAMVFNDAGKDLELKYPYFEKEAFYSPVEGSYADPTAKINAHEAYEWNYPLGEVVSSLITAGLRIEFLHEQPYACYQMFPFLKEGEDGLWRHPEKDWVPLQFSIRAVKPGEDTNEHRF